MIWSKFAWKRLENMCHKNQISLHQYKGSLDQFLNPNHSYISTDANPIQKNQKAAPEIHYQVWVFWQIFKNWKLGSRAIQAKILVPLPSWGFKEGFQIKNINSNAFDRYTEINFFSNKCIFVFWFAGILMAFCLWIHTNYLILKLTTLFDWVFIYHTWICHCCLLGFFKLWIGYF